MRKLCWLILLIWLLPFEANCGDTYYIRVAGDDEAVGTSWATAWATVAKANLVVTAGDTVLFGEGEYYGSTIRPPAGGDNSTWTVYACSTLTVETKHDPILYGGELHTGWTAHASAANTWWSLWAKGDEDCYNGEESYPSVLQNGYPLRGNLWVCDTETFDASCIDDEDSVSWAAGQCYAIDDTIWVWCRSDSNPNNADMVVSCQNPVHLDAAGTSPDISHVRIFGLSLQAGKQGTVMFWDQTDNVVIHHCKIGMGSTKEANACCVFSISGEGDKDPYDTTTFGHYNVVRACDIDAAWSYDTTYNTGGHGDGVILYCQKNFRVDSCDIYNGGSGINFKGKGNGTINPACVAAMNTVHDCASHGIMAWVHRVSDSIYGNFIYDIGITGIRITTSSEPWPGYEVVLFNTVYDVRWGFNGWDESNIDTCGTSNVMQYNIFDSTQYEVVKFEEYTSQQECEDQWAIDYNLYWNTSWAIGADFNCQCGNQFSDWQTCGHDANGSITTDVNLVDPANGDFSRTGLGAVTDSIQLGGRWFYYHCAGAWQPRDGGEGAGLLWPFLGD